MSRPYSIDEKNWFCVCMQQRKSQKTRLRKRRGRTYSSFWSSMALRGSLGKTERLLLPKIYLWFRMMRSYSSSHCLAPAYIRDPRLGTLCTRVEQMLPQPSYLLPLEDPFTEPLLSTENKKKVTLRGAQSRRGPAWAQAVTGRKRHCQNHQMRKEMLLPFCLPWFAVNVTGDILVSPCPHRAGVRAVPQSRYSPVPVPLGSQTA